MLARLLMPPVPPPNSALCKGERLITLTSEANLYDMHANNACFSMEYEETLKIEMQYPKGEDSNTHWTVRRDYTEPYILD